MGLADIIRSAVATANDITLDLQATVTHYAWISADATGKPTYASGVARKAIVEHRTKTIRNATGQEVVGRHKLTFLVVPTANGTSGRREPIDPRDKFVLPDGTTAPIASIEGVTDAESTTGRNYSYEVWLSEAATGGR